MGEKVKPLNDLLKQYSETKIAELLGMDVLPLNWREDPKLKARLFNKIVYNRISDTLHASGSSGKRDGLKKRGHHSG